MSPILWAPSGRTARDEFARFVARRIGQQLPDQAALRAWASEDADGYWALAAEYLGVRFHAKPTASLRRRGDSGSDWFPGSTLNYAEHALTVKRDDADVAVLFEREDGLSREVTYIELRDLVARARVGLQRHGVSKGDRVVAVAPNCVESLALFLATASLGAVWSACSPDLDSAAVQDRCRQLEPRVLFAVDGYIHGGKRIDVRSSVAGLVDALPMLAATVVLPYLDASAQVEGAESWAEFTAAKSPLAFEPVPFDHPLWVLCATHDAGAVEGVVQSHGGVTLEHLTMLRLTYHLERGDHVLWLATSGSMMWTYLVSCLALGATIVLFDGDPCHPDMNTVWGIVARHKVKILGTTVPFIQDCMKAELEPGRTSDLTSLRTIALTGAPLASKGHAWIAAQVGPHAVIASYVDEADVSAPEVGASPNIALPFAVSRG